MAQNKPDLMAWFVLQGTLAALDGPTFQRAADSRTLKLYEALARAAAKTRMVSRLVHALPYGAQRAIGEAVTSRGRLSHFVLRKVEIEKQARQALAEGATQFVNLGAGLDVLGLRLAEDYPNISFFDIDRPEVQRFKRQALSEGGIALPANYYLIEGDLAEPLPHILQTSRFTPGAHTLWLSEAFFFFFDEKEVRRIFGEMHSLSASGSQVIFTSVGKRGETGACSTSKQTAPKRLTPFRWIIPAEGMGAFLTPLKYAISQQVIYEALHKEYINGKNGDIPQIAEDISRAKMVN